MIPDKAIRTVDHAASGDGQRARAQVADGEIRGTGPIRSHAGHRRRAGGAHPESDKALWIADCPAILDGERAVADEADRQSVGIGPVRACPADDHRADGPRVAGDIANLAAKLAGDFERAAIGIGVAGEAGTVGAEGRDAGKVADRAGAADRGVELVVRISVVEDQRAGAGAERQRVRIQDARRSGRVRRRRADGDRALGAGKFCEEQCAIDLDRAAIGDRHRAGAVVADGQIAAIGPLRVPRQSPSPSPYCRARCRTRYSRLHCSPPRPSRW